MSVEFFSNSQHHLWERCRMKESFFWENLVEREISRRTLWDVSSLPGRPREISFSLAGSTTAWAVCIFRPISGPNGDLKTSLRVLYFHERSNPDADSDLSWAGLLHGLLCLPCHSLSKVILGFCRRQKIEKERIRMKIICSSQVSKRFTNSHSSSDLWNYACNQRRSHSLHPNIYMFLVEPGWTARRAEGFFSRFPVRISMQYCVGSNVKMCISNNSDRSSPWISCVRSVAR